jgi:tRNA (guanine37-N1)-methyltransferase
VVLTAAAAAPLTQADLVRWAHCPHLVVVAGHYEGVDQRVVDVLGAEERALGPFVLTGGELPAMVVVDGVVRLLPGVLGAPEGAQSDSFSGPDGLLEAPQYTRPPVYRGLAVPDVLLSGDHARVAAWRRAQSLERTRRHWPRLLDEGAGGPGAS